MRFKISKLRNYLLLNCYQSCQLSFTMLLFQMRKLEFELVDIMLPGNQVVRNVDVELVDIDIDVDVKLVDIMLPGCKKC